MGKTTIKLFAATAMSPPPLYLGWKRRRKIGIGEQSNSLMLKKRHWLGKELNSMAFTKKELELIQQYFISLQEALEEM